METQEENKSRKRIFLIILIVMLFLCIFISVYLIGYHIGTIGVSADVTKQLDVIKITSNSVGWNISDELNIFANPEFNNDSMIAPNSKGTYKFIVQNNSSEHIYYNLEFMEKNEHNINMKFRLKLDNIYIIGSKDKWQEPHELNMKDVLIVGGSKSMYTLEWYWEESEEDTNIGKKDYADYQLFINFTPDLPKPGTGPGPKHNMQR